MTFVVAIMMISVGMIIQKEDSMSKINTNVNISNFKIQNMAASANMIVKDTESKEENTESTNLLLTEVQMETAPASVIIPPRIEVYEYPNGRKRHIINCRRCENQLKKDDRYCSRCGQMVKKP